MLPDRFQQLRESFTKLRLVVVGDVMLDTYYWGGVARISPEAPVPIVSVDRLEHRPGGAANVAYNLISLGAKADLAGVVGSDTAGSQLEAALATYGIPATLLTDPQRPTTHKIRIIADSQHVARLDEGSEQWLEESLAAELCEAVRPLLPGADGLILQDYNKGTLPEQVIRQLFGWAGEARCPVFVDPKFANLDAYHGASLVKPNLTETEHFAGRSLRDEDDIIAAGTELRQRLAAEVLLITRGPAGMNLFDAEGHHPIPTRAREVADVCGAGDTVLSSYALASVAGASPREAAELAKFAAGTVVEEMGVVPVVPEKLEKLIQHHALA